MLKKICVKDSDFLSCITLQRKVEVWIADELQVVGKVNGFTENSVIVDGEYYMRRNCTFIMIDVLLH
jgi:hypothetical protein